MIVEEQDDDDDDDDVNFSFKSNPSNKSLSGQNP